MTREEAIEYAEKKNLKLEEEIERPGSYYGAYAMYSTELEFVSMAISALRQRDVTDKDVGKNDPLTLDELRKMDGEPVYCVEITGREEWLFRRDGGFADMYGEFTSDDFMVWDNYGKLWWCYRQKPEEGTV